MDKHSYRTNTEALRDAARSAAAGLAIGLPIGLIPSILAGWGRSPDPDEYDSDVGMLPNDTHPGWDELRKRIQAQQDMRREALSSLSEKTSSMKSANGDDDGGESGGGKQQTVKDILASAAAFSALPLGVGLGVYAGSNMADLYRSSQLNRAEDEWKEKLRTAYIKERLASQLRDESQRDPFNKYSTKEAQQGEGGGEDAGKQDSWGNLATGTAGLVYGVPAIITSLLAYNYFAENDPERKKTKILKQRLADLRQNQPHVDTHTDIDLSEDQQQEVEQFFEDLDKYKNQS